MHDQDTLDDDVRFLFEFLNKDEALAAIQKGRELADELHSRLAFAGDLHVVASDLVTLRAVAMGSLASVRAAVVALRKHVTG